MLLTIVSLCSVDNLREFVQQYTDGKLELYIKSEPVPEDNDGPVTVSSHLFVLWISLNNQLQFFIVI